MAFPNAENFQIHQSTFNHAQGDINYRIQRNYSHRDYFNQHINVHEEQDTRSRVHSAMSVHIHTAAFHDSGARRDPSRCYPGTREAALQTISHWTVEPGSHCLWLHGPAGTGKSAIAQTFAEKCHQDGTLGATYFFTKGSTSGPAGGLPPLFSTLAYQLMSVFPGLDDHLWTVIRTDRTIFERSLSTQLDKLIVQPLLRLASTFAPAVVIIDGLDECDGDSIQGEIVRLILGLEQYSLPLLFLISSRPESEIRRAFESSPRSSLVRLPLDKALHPDRDIRHFLVKEFERIYDQSVRIGMPPASQLPWPSTEDIKELVQKSSGHFIYAATVVRFVQEDRAHPMDRLDAILGIPGGSISSSTAKGIFVDSIAFRELDGLYLHILRKVRNRVGLVKILHAIIHFGIGAFAGFIETIFGLRSGSVCIMLEGLHSIINVPAGDRPLQFLHASFKDFLADLERSTHEFHLETSDFNAELACAYMRLIVAFSPSKSGFPLTMAIRELRGCLGATRAHFGLLSATLQKLTNITQELELSPPCLVYTVLDFLLQDVLKEFPEAGAERKYFKTILQRLEPQLIGLTDDISTSLRVLGAASYVQLEDWSPPFSLEKVGRFLGVPNGEKVVQKILDINSDDFAVMRVWRQPVEQIYKTLSHWLLTHHQPKPVDVWRPKWVAVHQYTWAWAWDTYISQYFPHTSVRLVHLLDFYYGCLRTLILEFDQSSNLISPPTEQMLEYASMSLRRHTGVHSPRRHFVEILERTDLTFMLRVLPDLTIICCPRVFYLHHGLDELYYCLQANESFTDPLIHDSHGPVPHYQKFLETLYSRLLQDPLASYAVPIIYAMFTDLTPLTIAQLLGLIPGELYGSAAMQGLFGADFWEKQEWIRISKSLGVLLKIGRVKLRPSQENKDGHIDERMRDAHEYLAISCARHLSSRTDPEGNTDWDSPSWYARQYWSDHLGRAKPSGRLFEILRCVNINGRDIEPVIRWLEESPSTPGDILARWHAARVDHSTECTWREKASCHLDRAVESRRSVRLGLGSKCMTKKKEAPSNKASRTESISKNLA